MVDHTTSILPERLAAGYKSGPEFLTGIVAISGGYERRNSRRAYPVWKFEYDASLQTDDNLRDMLDFYIDQRGSLYSWLIKDYWNYQLKGETALIGGTLETAEGGETTAQIVKKYGTASPYYRTIRHLVSGTLAVYVDGVLDSGATETNGLVTLSSALTVGQAVTIGTSDAPTEYYTAVRFANDYAGLQFPYAVTSIGQILNFGAVEVLE